MSLSIQARLSMGLGLLLGLQAVVIMFCYLQIRAIDARIGAINEITGPRSEVAQEMEANLDEVGFAILGYVHDADPGHLERAQDGHREFLTFRQRYGHLVHTASARDLGQGVDAEYAHFHTLGLRLLGLEDEQNRQLYLLGQQLQEMDDLLDEHIQPAVIPGDPEAYQKQEAALEIELNLNEMARDLAQFIARREAVWEDRLHKDAEDVVTFVQRYATLSLSPQERQWEAELVRLFRRYRRLAQDIVVLEKDKSALLKEFVQARRRLANLLEVDVQHITRQELRHAQHSVQQATAWMATVLLWLGLGSLGLGVLTVVRTRRGITRPLARLVAFTRTITHGPLAGQRVLPVGDEFALLAQSMNAMVAARREAEEALRQANDTLERRVQERTADLQRANQALYDEMAERQRLQEQLLQAQKMEAIGQLASGIAHDFNNVLAVIIPLSSAALDDLDPADPHRAWMEDIWHAGEQGAALMRQLLTLSRRQVFTPTVLSLNAVLTKAERLLRYAAGPRVRLGLQLEPALWPVRADLRQLEQVLLNLMTNARDAMPEGGDLTIRTSNVRLTEPMAVANANVLPGAYVELAVRDTGCGMDAATRARLFEPFFTTKAPGQGTGLGLATVYGIVQQSGGAMQVDSAPGRGSTFTIYLPQIDAPLPATPQAVEAPVTSLDGTETLVLVDDEAQVRIATSRLLRRRGYQVLEARDAGEALQLCEAYQGALHLLVTDVQLPDVPGPELSARLVQRFPALRTLLISGAHYVPAAEHPHGSPAAYLQKPFAHQVLLRKIRELLDTQAPPL